MALATRWIDTGDMAQVRWLNPHVDNGIITPDGNNNIVIHTYRETAWPWTGTVLAVRLIRLLSVLLGAGVVYFTYRLALELAPEQYGLALAAAAFAGFTPMFIFVSASVNNDTLAVFLSSAALWLMARWINGVGRKPQAGRRALTLPVRELVFMGAILGGAALSKESALGLFALAWAAVLYVHLKAAGFFDQNRFSLRALRSSLGACALSLVVVFGLAGLICGWWYWRNYQLYGDWLGWNAFVAIVGKRPHPATAGAALGRTCRLHAGLLGAIRRRECADARLGLPGAKCDCRPGVGWRRLGGRAGGGAP